MSIINFECDYTEGAHPRILERLIATNLEQTSGYGNDPYCAAAREKIKAACGTPDADVHFLVGGTQTNTTVLSAILRPYQGAVSADEGHIFIPPSARRRRSEVRRFECTASSAARQSRLRARRPRPCRSESGSR